jgi:hypothetical protein
MNYVVKVFEVAADAKPTDRPQELSGFAVSGGSVDEARRAVISRLTAEGRVVRSLSFTADGGLAAVVLPPAPPAQPDTHLRGGR